MGYLQDNEKYKDHLMTIYNKKMNMWEQEVFLTWHWWLGVLFCVIPIILWAWLFKRESIDRILYVGLFVALIAVFLDSIGMFFDLWEYNYDVLPTAANYLPWNFLVIPFVITSFIYIRPYGNTYLKAIIYAAFSSFIGLPILHWLNIYKPIHWHYYYSFFIQFFIYLFAKFISTRKNFNPL